MPGGTGQNLNNTVLQTVVLQFLFPVGITSGFPSPVFLFVCLKFYAACVCMYMFYSYIYHLALEITRYFCPRKFFLSFMGT